MEYVAYYRVSTQRQGASGLGLEAQRATIEAFIAGRGAIIGEFTEVESGKLATRPQLEAALLAAQRAKATLVIAKLDRLARNVAFIAALLEQRVPFVACDLPEANEFVLHVMAAVAQHEARTISERTKVALDAAKRRGVRLGFARDATVPHLNCDRARQRAEALRPLVEELRARGITSLRGLGRELGLCPRSVSNLLKRLALPAVS